MDINLIVIGFLTQFSMSVRPSGWFEDRETQMLKKFLMYMLNFAINFNTSFQIRMNFYFPAI